MRLLRNRDLAPRPYPRRGLAGETSIFCFHLRAPYGNESFESAVICLHTKMASYYFSVENLRLYRFTGPHTQAWNGSIFDFKKRKSLLSR